jgi:hypothetical protein
MNSQGDQRMDACRPVVAAWNISGHDAPVFVDDSGRRAHGVHFAGVAIALVCACWLAMLVFGMSGLTSLPVTGAPASASASARLISGQERVVDLEPLLGGKLRWADDTVGPATHRLTDVTYGAALPK